MSKSEELFKAASQEDNDLKAMGLMKKAIREKNSEKAEVFMKEIELKYKVKSNDPSKYTITTEKFGLIDYYPKANRVLIRKLNLWKDFGRDWLRKSLL